MRRVLVTGVSAVGKSTAVGELARRGVKAVDLDDPTWSEWVDSPDGDGPSPLHPGQDWLWREDRVARLLATETPTRSSSAGARRTSARSGTGST